MGWVLPSGGAPLSFTTKVLRGYPTNSLNTHFQAPCYKNKSFHKQTNPAVTYLAGTSQWTLALQVSVGLTQYTDEMSFSSLLKS